MKKCLTSFLLWMLTVCATAQTDTITNRIHQLEEVTVTESRRQHALKSTAPMQLLDRQDMLTMGVTDMADALHRLPGITLRDYGGAGGMKTVSVRGFGAKHTGVCYDGVMLSDCQSGEIDLGRYSLENVEQLVLTIGDNDDIFIPARQASTPAVLHIETLRMPNDNLQPHLITQLKVGSFGFVSPFVRYDQNVTDRFGFSVVGEYTYAENDYPYDIQNGTVTQHDRRTHSRMNQGHAEVNFVYEINKVNRLTGKLYYYDNDRQLPGQVHYYTNVSGETLRDRNAFGQLLYQTRWGEQLSMKVHAKYNWNESVFKDELMPGGVNNASYWQREVYTSVALLYVPHDRWALDYSADYSFNNLNGSSMRTVVGKPYRHTVLQSATAKYHASRLTLTGRLLYSLYLNDSKEGYSARNMRRLSPSLSVSYGLTEDESLYVRASYKNIFRSPTFNESYYYHYGSPDLKPESAHQLNLGATYQHQVSAVSFQASLDGYYNRVKDMIVAVPRDMFVWNCVNLGKVDVYGVDVDVRAAWQVADDHRLSLAANYIFQRAMNMTDSKSPHYKKQVAYLPQHTAGGSVSYENPWVNVTLHALAMSSRWANNEHYDGTRIDGYNEFGLCLWREFRWGNHVLTGRFDLKNLFDEQYELVRNYPMPGRSYQLTVNYKF